MKAGIIGTGSIGSAATGLARAGHDVTVSRRGEVQSASLAAAFPNITVAENQSVLDQSEIVFIALNRDIATAEFRQTGIPAGSCDDLSDGGYGTGDAGAACCPG